MQDTWLKLVGRVKALCCCACVMLALNGSVKTFKWIFICLKIYIRLFLLPYANDGINRQSECRKDLALVCIFLVLYITCLRMKWKTRVRKQYVDYFKRWDSKSHVHNNLENIFFIFKTVTRFKILRKKR